MCFSDVEVISNLLHTKSQLKFCGKESPAPFIFATDYVSFYIILYHRFKFRKSVAFRFEQVVPSVLTKVNCKKDIFRNKMY